MGCSLVGGHHFLPLPFFPPPAVISFFSTSLMTPTATVCFISLTANLPRGGNSEKASTTIGLDGVILTIPASPDLMDFGNSSMIAPVLLSILFSISANLHAIWQVWQSSTGA